MRHDHITAVVLAGGRGSRMGGVDKGLQDFNGRPLVQHAIDRLKPQVGRILISANRNLPAYAAFGAPVFPDRSASLGAEDYAGPLAGMLTGLTHCKTSCLLTVPCDVPFFPLDLADRLVAAMVQSDAEVVMAAVMEDEDGTLRPQPVFCLMRCHLLESLQIFIKNGGRKPGAWTAQLKTRLVAFDEPGDLDAFANANTLDELRRLQSLRPDQPGG
ncbi:MAG: molybdenum cofactor guanylyltransferase MobA [Polaromonas sp.]|nr:molybdenum cofactor guanylyltransferase MobA [Polaromonas sp.]